MSLELLKDFSATYAEARDKFLTACHGAGVTAETFRNPNKGPDGGELTTDVAWFGPRDAERVVLVMSGTHGVECMAGSSAQIGWTKSGAHKHLPPRTAVCLIHMINPFGAAWRQQETEEGVNLNRNFLDPAGPFPAAPLYAEIHDAVMCEEISGSRYEAAEAVVTAFREKNGLIGYQKAIFGGQYDYPQGMNYGGREPTWSARTFVNVMQKHLSRAREVIFLDFHTGLGPHAYASLITFCKQSDDIFKRASQWFGPTVMAVMGDDSAALAGMTGSAATANMPHAKVTPVTVEFGTYDIERECRAVRRDVWLRNFGDLESEIGREIRGELVAYFYPDDPNWKEMVWYRSQQVIRNGIDAFR